MTAPVTLTEAIMGLRANQISNIVTAVIMLLVTGLSIAFADDTDRKQEDLKKLDELNGRAEAHYLAGAYKAAEADAREALHLAERIYKPGHSEIGFALYQIAELCRRQNKFADAAPVYARAVPILKEVDSAIGRRCVAIGTHNLGYCYCQQGMYSLAEPILKQALEHKKTFYGADNYEPSGFLMGTGLIRRSGSRSRF